MPTETVVTSSSGLSAPRWLESQPNPCRVRAQNSLQRLARQKPLFTCPIRQAAPNELEALS
jgi:hypothetical protein